MIYGNGKIRIVPVGHCREIAISELYWWGRIVARCLLQRFQWSFRELARTVGHQPLHLPVDGVVDVSR